MYANHNVKEFFSLSLSHNVAPEVVMGETLWSTSELTLAGEKSPALKPKPLTSPVICIIKWTAVEKK